MRRSLSPPRGRPRLPPRALAAEGHTLNPLYIPHATRMFSTQTHPPQSRPRHTSSASGAGGSRKSKASTSMPSCRDLRYSTAPTREVRWISGVRHWYGMSTAGEHTGVTISRFPQGCGGEEDRRQGNPVHVEGLNECRGLRRRAAKRGVPALWVQQVQRLGTPSPQRQTSVPQPIPASGPCPLTRRCHVGHLVVVVGACVQPEALRARRGEARSVRGGG